MSGVMLIIILLVASGLIAYAGDYVGRKAGKKKLTIFNLRPKYTSRIISVLTGILIMVFALIVLSVFSENVRIALFGMEKLKKEISTLQLNIKSKEKEFSEIIKKYEAVKEERGRAIKELESYKIKLNELEEDRAKILEELNKLSKEREILCKENEKLQRSIYEISQKISSLSKEREKLLEEKKELLDEIQFLNTTITNMRTEGIVFRRGELILNYISKGDLTEEKAKEEAKVLLSLIENIAKERGAGNEEKGFIWVPEAEWIKLLNAFTTSGEKLIRVFSLANIFEGEPALITFEIYPYKLIFKKGDVLVLKVIDGSEDLNKIESKLLEILSEVNKIAQQKGVLPDPLTNTVGEISFEEFYNIVYKIKEKDKKFLLKVIVDEDTYNSGPLKIRFEL
ncbi:DUF3084 domain-containing protein [Dictyoglomus sp.]|jgi:uncharacterized protein (DUF3084 family)|uniref:DUF3084 domain-containing protein n=1 Tax=Dictyoglomus sp. TaxID=28205 RepID=UPI003D128E5E